MHFRFRCYRTPLSKGWGLIKRFSEDIDFKVSMPAGVSRNKAKKDRSTADSDEVARVHRSHAARRSNLMPPTIPI